MIGKRCWMTAACCALLWLPVTGVAQETKTPPKMAVEGTPVTPAATLNAALSVFESEVVGAAEAMPADKYDFAPSVPGGDFKGVRTFGDQVKHLAQSSSEFFHGFGVPGGVDPKSLDNLKTKDELVKALKDSFAYAHAAISSITPENAFLALKGPENFKSTRVSMAAFYMGHSMDHYGQMVEYLRMNGIIPPASRPGASM